ncbi:2087_t:CDS:2 [Gigaspora rosea]|nr:2087_t:CDS:2 [Gigaspora rosea]
MWNSDMFNDISTDIATQINSDETIENSLESNQSISTHLNTHSEAIYFSRKYDSLSCKNDINSNKSNHLDSEEMQENDKSLLIIDPFPISQDDLYSGNENRNGRGNSQ